MYRLDQVCLENGLGEAYRLWGAGEAVLEAGAVAHLEGVAFDQVGHRVLRAPTVHNLVGGVVRIGDQAPRHVAEELAALQLAHRFTRLQG